MSRFRFPGAIIFSCAFFFFSFFLRYLSAEEVAKLPLNQTGSQPTKLHQAHFQPVPIEQFQFKKNESRPIKSIQAQMKPTQAESSRSRQAESLGEQAKESQLQQSQSQQNKTQQTQTEQARSEQTQAQQTQSQQTQRSAQDPKQVHFYNVDSERKIDGIIQEIILEPRYAENLPFLIIVIKEKKTGEIYKVELSPAWFFNYDLHKGESIKILGSFYSQNNENFLIAREVQVGGETFRLRDGRGFPNWRGGPMKGKAGRRIRGK